MRKRVYAGMLALFCAVVMPGFKQARMRVPEALAAVVPTDVAGHQVRTLNKPMTFGEYRAGSVREGFEFSWSVEAFGVRGGSARMRYRFVLEAPEGGTREVECRNRAIEAWRKGWSVELTDAFTPRLACGIHAGGRTLRLVLGSKTGRDLRGALMGAEGEAPLLALRSIHALEGSPLPLEEPAGYVLERGGVAVAAVETLNRGRVWLAPELDAELREIAAATAAALLLYKPDLTPQID